MNEIILLILIFVILLCVDLYIEIIQQRGIEEINELIINNQYSINNHPAIIHEMVHVHIHERFGFKKWRIIPKDKTLTCIMTLPKSILYPKYYPKLFLWAIMHLVHDLFPFNWMDIENITQIMKEFFSLNLKIIKKMRIKESE